ncbi:MAG TPA: MFS transporter [Chloroflexia bacterium]|nr:MFS transporter [Chloroflexia bacterium]
MITAPARARSIAGLPFPYASFLGGLTISKLGDAIYTFALPWISFELTHNAVVMGALYATEILPVLLFGAFAGVFVDRWERRKLMLMADAIRAGIVAVLPLLHYFSALQIWHLFIAAFALALVSLAFEISTTAVIPELAGSDLTRANASHQLIMQAGSMAGPALAGLVIAAMGGFNALWLDAASFSGTFLVLLGLPAFRKEESARNATTVVEGIKEGFRWLWGNSVIKVMSLQATMGNFGFGMVSAVLMYYLRDTLGLSAEISGLNYAMLGVGGMLGSLAIVPLSRRYRKGQLYPAILLFGMSGLLLMALLKVWWAPGLGFGMVSACNVAWVVLSTGVRQELIPAELLGRVLTFSRMLSTAAMPVGAVVGGLLTQSFDPAVVFLIAALTKGVEYLIATHSPMHKL